MATPKLSKKTWADVVKKPAAVKSTPPKQQQSGPLITAEGKNRTPTPVVRKVTYYCLLLVCLNLVKLIL